MSGSSHVQVSGGNDTKRQASQRHGAKTAQKRKKKEIITNEWIAGQMNRQMD